MHRFAWILVLSLAGACGGDDDGGSGTDAGRTDGGVGSDGGDTDGGGSDTDGGGGDTDGGAGSPVGLVFSTSDGVGVAAHDGTDVRMLDDRGASSHVVSPDGTRIAYRGEGGLLYVVPVAGGTPEEVSTSIVAQGLGYHEPLYYGWSADGSKLWYFESASLGYVLSPDGSDEVVVPGYFRVSPDGSKVAYLAVDSGSERELWVMPTDGSASAEVISGDATGVEPEVHRFRWSPDGTRIAYTQDRDASGTHVFVADPDGTNETQLTTTGGSYPSIAWAPDGSFLVYMDDAELWRADADGTGKVRLATRGWSPQVSPSGDWVAYLEGDLAVVPADGSADGVVVGPEFEDPSVHEMWEPGFAWAPDESRLLYRAKIGITYSLHSVLIDGTGDVEIAETSPPTRSYGFVDADTVAWSSSPPSPGASGSELFIGAADGSGDPLHSSYGGGTVQIRDMTEDRLCEMQVTSGGLGSPSYVTIHLWQRDAGTWNGTEVVASHQATTFMGCTLLD